MTTSAPAHPVATPSTTSDIRHDDAHVEVDYNTLYCIGLALEAVQAPTAELDSALNGGATATITASTAATWQQLLAAHLHQLTQVTHNGRTLAVYRRPTRRARLLNRRMIGQATLGGSHRGVLAAPLGQHLTRLTQACRTAATTNTTVTITLV